MYCDGWVVYRTWWQTDGRSLSLSHFNAAKPDSPDSERRALQTGRYTSNALVYTENDIARELCHDRVLPVSLPVSVSVSVFVSVSTFLSLSSSLYNNNNKDNF